MGGHKHLPKVMVVQAAAAAAMRPPHFALAKLFSSGSDHLACGLDEDTEVQENMSPDPKQVSGRAETESWVS